MSTIVVVESPAKAVKIQKMLGKNYIVKSSFGHLRNLKGKNKGVDVANNFKPIFEITKRIMYNPAALKKTEEWQFQGLRRKESFIGSDVVGCNDIEELLVIYFHVSLLKLESRIENKIKTDIINIKTINSFLSIEPVYTNFVCEFILNIIAIRVINTYTTTKIITKKENLIFGFFLT